MCIHPLLLGCSICWHIIVYSSLLWFFVFPRHWLKCLSFHFWFYWLGTSLFLMTKGCQLCLSPQRASSLFHWPFVWFSASISFIYALIFIISFLLPTLGFSCSFSSFFRYKFLDYLFENILIFWGRPISLWAFLLELLCCIQGISKNCVSIFI